MELMVTFLLIAVLTAVWWVPSRIADKAQQTTQDVSENGQDDSGSPDAPLNP